jgi:hypothetical protein
MADIAGSSYFKHVVDGKEVRTPGLNWFAGIVRTAILGYLNSVPAVGMTDERLLAKLAQEKAVVQLKMKRIFVRGRH